MARLSLAQSESLRESLTLEEEARISAMYSDLAKEVKRESQKLNNKTNISSAFRQIYFDNLSRQIEIKLNAINTEVESLVKSNMRKVAEGVIADNKAFLSRAGMSIQGAFLKVPDDVVRNIITGHIYTTVPGGQRWSLSGAIWSHSNKTLSDIHSIISGAVLEGKSTLAIARDIEMYVDPKAAKPWDWSKVYPGTSTKVDYNAQRLARTLVSHAYQLSLVTSVENNPFVTGFIWHSSGGERVCPICADRDQNFYSKGELPLDHPNGMCFWEAVIPNSWDQVADRLADWAHGANDAELDTFARSIM